MTTELNFNNLLEMSGSVIEQILTEREVEQARKTNSPELKKYLSKHLPRLLRIAFRENCDVATLMALKLLSSGSSFIIPNLVKSPYFPNYVMKILSKYEHRGVSNIGDVKISSILLSRISQITLSIFQTGAKDILDHCGFIILLVQYCDNLSVFNLFQEILSKEKKMQKYREWLFGIGFESEVAGLLKDVLKLNLSNTYSTETELAISLLRIVADAAKHPELREQMINGPIFEIFEKDYFLPFNVMNYYWEALNNLCTSDNTKHFSDLASTALKLLEVEYITKIHRFHSEAIHFLSKFVHVEPQLFDKAFFQNILNLMEKASSSSFFLCDTRNLIQECLLEKELREQVVKIITPFLLESSKMNKNGLISYFSIAMIEDISKNEYTTKIFKGINGASNFVKKTLNPLIKKREKGYSIQYVPKNADEDSKPLWQTQLPRF